MERFIAFLEKNARRLPGPGKIIVGGLLADRGALRTLIACMAAILAATLQPPVLSLSVAHVQQGLRDPGSIVPLQVAAAYLLLAVLTLVGGASGDLFGRKRYLLFGLFGVLATNVAGIFLFDTPHYSAVNALNTITTVLVMPMTIALVTVAFPFQVRPFAYGALFACQGLGLVAASSLYGIFAPTNFVWAAFIPAVILGVIAIRLVWRDADESRAPGGVSRQELILNVFWAAAIFGLVYGLLAFGGGLTGLNTFLIVAICLIGFVIAYRWVMRRAEGHSVKLYNVRDLSLAILAGIMLSLAQGTLFYQIGAFFQKIQSIGPVQAGLQLLPYILAMMLATLVIVRVAMHFGARRIISFGIALMAVGLMSMYFVQATTPYWQLILPLFAMGFGFGIAAPARTVVVLTNAPPGLTGMAAGVNVAAGQSGFTLGIILSSLMLTEFASRGVASQLEQLGASPNLVQAAGHFFQTVFSRAIAGNMTRAPEDLAKQVAVAFGDVFTSAMVATFLVVAFVLALSAFVVYVGMSRGLKASFISEPFNARNKPTGAEPANKAQDGS